MDIGAVGFGGNLGFGCVRHSGTYTEMFELARSVGKPLDEDPHHPIISARQLVFHQAQPPTALVAAIEAKRSEEVLFT